MTKAFDFEKEVECMKNDLPIDGNSLILIWGGVFDVEKFKGFMVAWSFADMSYVIQEHAHDIAFQIADTNNIVSQNPALLERMEIFGASGNLSLRRNGNEFLWHFIGHDTEARQDTLSKLEAAQFKVREFWKENSECRFYKRDESALLWGEYDGNRWHDDRVGWANLDYPIGPKQRVQIDYTVFTDNGQTSFVWWKELKEAKQ
jgi:hypothetical protein